MVNAKCPHCGSAEIFVSDSPFHDTFMIKTDAGGDLYSIECFLCLNCRAMEMRAAERSPSSLFGKSKSLVEEIPKSSNWKKVT